MLRFLKRLIIGVILVGVVVVVIGLVYRAFRQHQLAMELVIDSANTIDEQHYVEANGIVHWITIRGEDRGNPVIFFVHGGPGEVVSFAPSATKVLEAQFTVVHWDQRGAGRTYGRNSKPATGLTVAQMRDDGIEIVRWVTQHLGQPKVILLGALLGHDSRPEHGNG